MFLLGFDNLEKTVYHVNVNRSLVEVFPNSRIREMLVTTTPGWTANNPSITSGPNGYRFTLRSSNFVLDPSGMSHQTVEPQGIIKTINYVGQMDNQLKVVGFDKIDTSQVDGPVQYPWVLGMEDCRIWWDVENSLWKVSGSYRQHRSDGIPTIAVDTLDGFTVVEREVLSGDDPNQFQKNWMPTGLGNKFLRGPWGTEPQLRGSSQAIALSPNRYCGVLHYVTWPGRCYWHCFGLFDIDGKLLNISEPFYFRNSGVEFANGMTVWDDHFVITFGYREARCFMAYVPVQDVVKVLW